MSDYASPNADQILTKTNSLVGIKMTEFPQYKSAITPSVKFQMARSDTTQLPGILTKDVNNSLQTMKTITQYNDMYKNVYGM